ncbi:MAG: hypothetical protein ACLP9L_16065 [Thermoguttaceae bacterium]
MHHNENSKTGWFLAAAAVVVAVAWLSYPSAAIRDEAAVLGKKLFPDFKDPGVVDSLQILQFDQAKGDPVVLEVAKQNGLWVIPSHSKYPADAKDHLAAAANSLIDLTIVGLAPGFNAGSPPMDQAALRKAHNHFGVVDPDPKNVKSSDEGIGKRVTMKDAAGHQLAAAIVGKAVPDQSDLYYVRFADKDPVYIVKLDAGKLSVQFDEWIEPNLLNLNTMDLKKVEIKDYSVTPMQDPENSNAIMLASAPKGEFTLDAPSGDQPWKLVQELDFDPAKKKMTPRPMAADEELNVTNLDALKSALEDLKIVDVERKPAAVPANLRVRKIDNETRATLMERGFFVLSDPQDRNGPLEILSNSGDITLQLADGARYILRFGMTTGESSAAEKAKKKGSAKTEKEDKAKDDSSPGVDRYLFVTADFNLDAIPKPVAEKLPEAKPADSSPDKKAPDKKADNKEAKPAEGDKKGEVKKDDAKKEVNKPEEPKKDAPAKSEGDKKDEPKKDEPKKNEAKKEDVKKNDAAKEAKTPEALAAQRAEIEKENKRRQDEYEAKVAAGKKHAKELGDRFAQWYYVIPGQTYAKIHLDRKEIIKKKEPPKDAAGHEHDHDKDHTGADALPPSPAATLEQLKKDAPPPPEKK